MLRFAAHPQCPYAHSLCCMNDIALTLQLPKHASTPEHFGSVMPTGEKESYVRDGVGYSCTLHAVRQDMYFSDTVTASWANKLLLLVWFPSCIGSHTTGRVCIQGCMCENNTGCWWSRLNRLPTTGALSLWFIPERWCNYVPAGGINTS